MPQWYTHVLHILRIGARAVTRATVWVASMAYNIVEWVPLLVLLVLLALLSYYLYGTLTFSWWLLCLAVCIAGIAFAWITWRDTKT
jgi:ABC-type methionine transport system permease subunit